MVVISSIPPLSVSNLSMFLLLMLLLLLLLVNAFTGTAELIVSDGLAGDSPVRIAIATSSFAIAAAAAG